MAWKMETELEKTDQSRSSLEGEVLSSTSSQLPSPLSQLQEPPFPSSSLSQSWLVLKIYQSLPKISILPAFSFLFEADLLPFSFLHRLHLLSLVLRQEAHRDRSETSHRTTPTTHSRHVRLLFFCMTLFCQSWRGHSSLSDSFSPPPPLSSSSPSLAPPMPLES